MGRYFIELSYDGTEYCGWQRQPNSITVEETITSVLNILLREKTEIVGCGRTDTGVSASDYYAHFDTEKTLDTKLMTKKLNMMLPKDIFIKRIFPCGLHARFDATLREYKYFISKVKNPFNHHIWTIHQQLDVIEMKKGCEMLRQYSDFTSFAKLHTNSLTNICHIFESDIEENENGYIITISANRFLRGMVRAITGTLVDLGKGKITLEQFRIIIEKHNRALASMQAPASGLFLTRILYPGF